MAPLRPIVVLVLALLLGACGGDSSDGASAAPTTAATRDTTPPTARDEVGTMPLERRIGELLVISYAGTSPPRYVLRALREGRAAGVILFGGNAPDAATVKAATARLQRAAGGDAIVSLDQEGGEIRTLAFAPPAVGQARQGTPAAAGAAAAATARALRGVGVNVVLGPVADVADTAGSFMAGRAYPGDAARVTASVRAAVDAYARAGVAATLKHFPGLGGAPANTDRSRTLVRAPLQRGLTPYRRCAAAAPLVMVSSARYAALPDGAPAVMTPAVYRRLLPATGFAGVTISDDLQSPALAGVSVPGVQAARAGLDLLLYAKTETGARQGYAELIAAVEAKKLNPRAIRASARRVLALKASYAR